MKTVSSSSIFLLVLQWLLWVGRASEGNEPLSCEADEKEFVLHVTVDGNSRELGWGLLCDGREIWATSVGSLNHSIGTKLTEAVCIDKKATCLFALQGPKNGITGVGDFELSQDADVVVQSSSPEQPFPVDGKREIYCLGPNCQAIVNLLPAGTNAVEPSNTSENDSEEPNTDGLPSTVDAGDGSGTVDETDLPVDNESDNQEDDMESVPPVNKDQREAPVTKSSPSVLPIVLWTLLGLFLSGAFIWLVVFLCRRHRNRRLQVVQYKFDEPEIGAEIVSETSVSDQEEKDVEEKGGKQDLVNWNSVAQGKPLPTILSEDNDTDDSNMVSWLSGESILHITSEDQFSI